MTDEQQKTDSAITQDAIEKAVAESNASTIASLSTSAARDGQQPSLSTSIAQEAPEASGEPNGSTAPASDGVRQSDTEPSISSGGLPSSLNSSSTENSDSSPEAAAKTTDAPADRAPAVDPETGAVVVKDADGNDAGEPTPEEVVVAQQAAADQAAVNADNSTRVEFKPSYRRHTARTYLLLKRALDRLQIVHASDCAVYNEPAYPNGPCNCGAIDSR